MAARCGWRHVCPARGRRSPARRRGRRTPAPARSTSQGARLGIPAGRRPAAGTTGNRAALRPRGSGTGQRAEWSRPTHTVRPELVEGLFLFLGRSGKAVPRQARDERFCLDNSKYLYAILIVSNRPHGCFSRPASVVKAAIARLDPDVRLFAATPIMLKARHGGAGRAFAHSMALVASAAV